MPVRSCREQRDIHSTCRWERVVPRSLRTQRKAPTWFRGRKGVTRHRESWKRLSAPLLQRADRSVAYRLSLWHTSALTLPVESQSAHKNPITSSPLQLPQLRAGNAIRGSARPAGSALRRSGWSTKLRIFQSLIPQLSLGQKILHLWSREDNLQGVSVWSWRIIWMTQSWLQWKWRNCLCVLTFIRTLSTWASWYATNPSVLLWDKWGNLFSMCIEL